MAKRRVCACGCFGRNSFEKVFDVLRWSLIACVIGKHPRVDHLGVPWPPGRRKDLGGSPLKVHGALLRKFGDWQWYKQALGLVGWTGEGPTRRICFQCPASLRGEAYAFDFPETAAWRTFKLDMSTFWENVRVDRAYVSQLWGIPGLVLKYIKIDWMHCVELGILSDLNGNIL